MKHITKSPDETFDLASDFASSLPRGAVLLLTGELGSGKTRFVQGMAEGLGVPKDVYVKSPSFAIINEYRGGRVPLYHLDFYRLDKPSELFDFGLEEYLGGDGIVAIEWADRFPDADFNATHRISFRIVDENTREISLEVLCTTSR